MLIFFKKISRRWLLFLNPWDLISIFAYTQIVAFLESAMFLLVLILLGALLPARLFRHRFVAQGSAIVLLTSICAAVLHYKPGTVSSPKALLFGAALYFVFNGVVCVLVRCCRRFEAAICAFAERLTALLYVYVALTFLGVIIVVLRNI